jgi:hypothetical protein
MMKLYTLFSESHRRLYEEYFKPTLPDEFELKLKSSDQLCETGDFMSEGWSDICYQKVLYFKQACEENIGSMFIWADVDIQFFRPFKSLIITELGDADIACQNDFGDSHCSGLFICRANDETLKMFTDMVNDYHREDQTTLNMHIHKVNHKFLSSRFFNYGQSMGVTWEGEEFEVDESIVLHHANWTVGLASKIKMLDYVKSRIGRSI